MLATYWPPEGSGSSPVSIDQKENLLKVWSMKKQGNKWNAWSARLIRQKRPLEVVANTNPTLAPMGESPMAQWMICFGLGAV